MKYSSYISLVFIPQLVSAHGGDDFMPIWLSLLLLFLALAFPATFLFLGYLMFMVEKQERLRFIWMYVFAFAQAVLALICLINSLSDEKSALAIAVFGALVIVLPSYTAYMSYMLNRATGGKYARWLRYCWGATLISVVVFIGFPLLIIFVPQALEFISLAIR